MEYTSSESSAAYLQEEMPQVFFFGPHFPFAIPKTHRWKSIVSKEDFLECIISSGYVYVQTRLGLCRCYTKSASCFDANSWS